jgi:hypothetical protein
VSAERWDKRPAAREEGTPSAVLTVAQAEELAVRTLAAIDAFDADERRYADVRHYWHYAADRERIASDLAGLREHHLIEHSAHGLVCRHGETLPCPDARRYSDGLLRTADLYGAQP